MGELTLAPLERIGGSVITACTGGGGRLAHRGDGSKDSRALEEGGSGGGAPRGLLSCLCPEQKPLSGESSPANREEASPAENQSKPRSLSISES